MATAEHESRDSTKTAVSKQVYANTKFGDKTITEWIDGSSNRNVDATEIGALCFSVLLRED